MWLAAPAAFDGSDGRVTAVRANRMRLGAPDASGRRAPEVDPGGAEDMPADLVIKALGFDAEELPLCGARPNWALRAGARFWSIRRR